MGRVLRLLRLVKTIQGFDALCPRVSPLEGRMKNRSAHERYWKAMLSKRDISIAGSSTQTLRTDLCSFQFSGDLL